MAMLATACTKDDSALVGNESLVSFSVSSPELQTRYGEGNEAKVLNYAFYNEDGILEAISAITAEKAVTLNADKKATIQVSLVEGRKYSAIFWASAPDAIADEVYTVNWTAKTVEMATNLTANDESYDAFYNYTINIDPAKKTHKIELTRPFAQLNIATKDLAKAVAAGVDVKATKVTVNAYNKLKFAVKTIDGVDTGVADVEGEKVEFTYGWAPVIENEKVMTDYDLISMNYVSVNTRELVNVTLRMSEAYTDGQTDAATDIVRTYTTVPVQRNYRTYIVGNLLTTPNDFNVETKPGFDGEEVSVVWDGTSTTKPAYNDATQTYTVKTGAELAWLANLVNGTLPSHMRSTEYAAAESLQGVTIELKDNIDLGGNQWTPIGTSDKPFKGTFDGKKFTVGNLVITGNNSNVGLFGVTTDGEIKNLVVENAKVSGRLNVGVVAGTPYTSKYTNITVKGHVEVNGMAYVGGVGGKNAYANWTNITVKVDETSYVKANSVENGTAYRTYVGGVVGFNGEGGHTFSNIKSNINVEGTTLDVGGLFGIAHYGNQFVNCECSGKVTITTDEAENALEMGGIAGVWHNGGETVVFTNCSFTGELNTLNVVEDVDFYYGGLVGAPYSATGAGKLIIDGIEYSVAGVNHKQLNEILAETGELVFANDMECKADGNDAVSNAYGKTGLNQVNGGVIDGQGHTLTVKGAGGTWDSAINTTGGTIKNLTIDSGFRGIFVNHNSNYSDKVVLENVTIDGPVYTISCDQGTNNGLEAYNSTFNGWTSYAATIGKVTFTECSFGEGAGYAFCRPYAPTTFIGCEFEAGFEMDPRAKVTFVDCTLAGVALTEANLSTLVTSGIENAGFHAEVTDNATLAEALANGSTYVEVAAGEYTFPASSIAAGAVIKCEEGTVFTGNSKLNIKGATVEGATFSNPSGTAVDQTINGTFKNCKFEGVNGVRWAYSGDTVVFEDCVFDGSTYGVHFDGGANDVVFRNCTISGFNALASSIAMVTFEGCTFVGNGKSGYNGANLWGSAKLIGCEFTFDGTTANEWIDCIGADKTYEFTSCTVNGVDFTAENYTSFEQIFSRNNVTVKINGVDCAM